MADHLPPTAFAGSVWFITAHVRDRWAERFDPDAPSADVVRLLAQISREAIDTGGETPNGHALFLHPAHPQVRFVVARRAGGEHRPTLVTVIDASPRRLPKAPRAWRQRG